MKVLEEGAAGVRVGDRLDLAEMDLPASGDGGLLIVFWKER